MTRSTATTSSLSSSRRSSTVSATLGLVRACHPAPTATVTVIATALAVATGRGWGVVAVAAAVAAGQLTVGWSNDYLDRERDACVGRWSKPIVSGDVQATTVGRSAVVAFALCAGLSLLSGGRAAAVHLSAVLLGLVYNAWLKGTLASPLPYALAFAALPTFITLGAEGGSWPPWWAAMTGASFGVGAHMVNTLDDIADDRRVGVLGLPQRIGEHAALFVGVVSMLTAVAVSTFAPEGTPRVGGFVVLGLAAAAALAVVVAARAGRSEAAWRMSLAMAALPVSSLVLNGERLT